MSDTEILPGSPACQIHHRFARVNGVTLHFVEAFPAATNGKDARSGQLCLMLHGFPEFWYAWGHQIPALAAAGFHVLAPDLRGYNLSDKPRGVSAYSIDALLGDVIGLIENAGAERAAVAGHDWGGVIAWRFAMRYPQVVEKLIILNAPHPAAYRRELRSWRQLLKSWYVFFFQVPGLPEQLLGGGDFDWLGRLLRRHPRAFGSEDVRRYKQALARPGALKAALNYYRAFMRHRNQSAARDDGPINVPVLLLWGERDLYLSPCLTVGLDAWVPNLRVVRFPDASHWVQNDAPERVNRLMVDFLTSFSREP
ncbi:MAG TPA: alpha/beta fold hydrolase [Gemmataceae bacterium]|nr:alpha/beta fold hydrolase [Gemmataceae bacterium]